jgi:hypothetical protein
LYADQQHHPRAGLFDKRRHVRRAYVRIRFVESVDLYLNVVAKHLLLGAFKGKPVEHRQRIRWDGGSKPLYDVTVVIVVRRLDQYEAEPMSRRATRFHLPFLSPE